jgi:Flp pilus assembly pilin Flp
MTPALRCNAIAPNQAQRVRGKTLNPKQYEGANEMKRIMNFINDESGMETLEYAVIAGLIAVVAVLVYGGGWGANLVARLTAATNAS